MWTWRNMENISWKGHMTNEYVLDQVNEKRKLLNTILERKKRWLGHILRGESLLKEVIEGRMEGKKRRGKPRIIMLDDIKAGELNLKIKREPWIENVEETGCLEPAFKQNTNYDDHKQQEKSILLIDNDRSLLTPSDPKLL